ncbi:MAG TPA: peptidoglycan-binding protein [Ilumatobacter sp.]|nr:peptidoglycan-binding protein [Ilumatobacter sp.]
MADDHTQRSAVDPDEPPIFDIEDRDEADPATPRGELVLEGVRIPPDVVAHGNGRLPPTALREIGVYRHRLHPSAAAAFAELRAAAASAGIELSCTDSYRSIEEQEDLKLRKPSLSATPGKSVHGWGFAVDLSLGLPPKPFGQSVLDWLKTNAPELGWYLGRPKDEPWHWVYRGDAAPLPDEARPAATTTTGSDRLAGWVVDVDVVRRLLGVPTNADQDAVVVAVVTFQRQHQLADDGVVGPRTKAALFSQTVPAERPELRQGASGDAVRWVQMRVGCVPDGKFGPATERALREFQRGAGLADDGVVGPKTWAALVA